MLRSLVLYYGNPFRLRSLSKFYAQFIQPGDLCFDIGAHVGNRTLALRRSHARVIAVEPQPSCIRVLKSKLGPDPKVTIVPKAVGVHDGQQEMFVSRRTPTVSSLSHDWISKVRRSTGFRRVQWDAKVTVPVTTLDVLIDEYGLPAFTKIDVEGYESEVLQGLSCPLPVISFEYIPAVREIALVCIERLNELGSYQYNWTIKESSRFQFRAWVDKLAIEEMLTALPSDHDSGDIYCKCINVL